MYFLTSAPKEVKEDLNQSEQPCSLLASSLSAWSNFASLTVQNAPSEDSDETVRMLKLIWIFAGR